MTESSTWLEFPSGERIYFEGSCSIGRSPSNRVILPTDKVSRRHAVIRREEGGACQILDFGSSNGTYVNGQRIAGAVPLSDGSVVEIGMQKMIFRTLVEASGQTVEETEAECWLLVLDSAALGTRVPSEELSDKTFESWTARCERVVKKFQGRTIRALNEGFLAFWPATGSDGGAKNIGAALRSLRAVQMQNEEFRFGLHFGPVKLRTEPGKIAKPVGDNVIFTMQIQRLLPRLKPAVILSAAAAQLLAAEMPVRGLTVEERRGFGGTEIFSTLA